MNVRHFQKGDETFQADIYNTAAAALPKFKPASVQEVVRRVRARDFDPGLRFYATDDERVIGYCLVNPNGRVSYPWCLPGFEHAAQPLFAKVLETAKHRGITKVFAAYRGDWPTIHTFFEKQGFHRAREVVNFLVELVDMPTPSYKASSSITPLVPNDVALLFEMLPEALRINRSEDLSKHLFHNPYFTKEALYALRNRQGAVMAAGIMVYDPSYADPHAVDASMPCYRLGAFGTEGMQTKRLKGLFSFLAKPDASLPSLAMDLMAHAAYRVRENDDITALAAQAATDVPALLTFYERYFKKQGSFPVFEMMIQ